MTEDSGVSVLPAQMPLPSARDHAIDILQKRVAEDRISISDFEHRLALAHEAHSVGELEALIADLAPANGAARATGHTSGLERGRIVTILSNHERNGAMPIPRRLEIVSVLGNVELDLRDATFLHGATEIDISSVLGNVELTLPLGVRIESTGDAVLGNFEHRSDPLSGPADPKRVIRVTGKSFLGSVKVESGPSSSGVLHDGRTEQRGYAPPGRR